MNKLKVYLSGATKLVDEEFQSWRGKCSEYVEDGFYCNIKFINPINYFNYTDKQPKTDKQCLDLFIWQIDHCDILLCNMDNSDLSIGTGMEVEHAFCKGIPVVAFGNKPGTWYNWITTRTSVIFDSLEDAIEYINNSYGDMTN